VVMEEGESTSLSLLPRRVFRAETFECLSSLLSDHASLSDKPVEDSRKSLTHKSSSSLSTASSNDEDDDGSESGDSWGFFIC
jgi:hypothetical protein